MPEEEGKPLDGNKPIRMTKPPYLAVGILPPPSAWLAQMYDTGAVLINEGANRGLFSTDGAARREKLWGYKRRLES